MKKKQAVTVLEPVEPLIHEIRGERVMLDSDLARVYGVPTFRFNEAIKRNIGRFPEDFRFQLTSDEAEPLRSQIAILRTGRGQHRKYLPYAFTEHGAIMAANVLSSRRAVEMSIHVIRAFVTCAANRAAMRNLRASSPPWNATNNSTAKTSR